MTFTNPHNLVDDGRSADRIVMDWFHARGDQIKQFNIFRGPRASEISEAELASQAIDVQLDLEAAAAQPLEIRVAAHMRDLINRLEYAQELGRLPRDVRNWVRETTAEPPSAAEIDAILAEVVGSLEMIVSEMGNWLYVKDENGKPARDHHGVPINRWDEAAQRRARLAALAKRAEILYRIRHGRTYAPINTAPISEWILIKTECSLPVIARYSGDVTVLEAIPNADEFFSSPIETQVVSIAADETTWTGLDGEHLDIKPDVWMAIEQPTFDEGGRARFSFS